MPYPLLRRSGLVAALGGVIGLLLAAGSCATPPANAGGLDPRYVAVHNVLAASGLVEVGPIRRGPLALGREARVTLDLPAQCTTLVVMGTAGVGDLDVTLLDSSSAPVVRDASHDAEAALRACVQAAGPYTLVIKTASGPGEYVLATWTGASALGGPSTALAAGSPQTATGTCEAPIRIGVGEYSGSTTHGDSENEGSCASSGAKELVYRLDLTARKNVTVEVTTTRFDSVLYVRKNDCGDESTEVACNDDAPNQHRSKIDAVFDPGTYYVFVDGYGSDGGPFQLRVSSRDIPPLKEVCGKAQTLASGTPDNGSMSGAFDEVNATCGEGAHGPDVPFSLAVAARSRVRVRQESDDFTPVVHVRKICDDEGSEIGCAAAEGGGKSASFVGLLDPGTYTVFADAVDHEADGRFTIAAEVGPEQGSGVPGDTCADALPLRRGEGPVHGDTFRARDDSSGSCGGSGAADVLYKLELGKRSRFVSTFTTDETAHVFVLSKLCADRSSEIVCGSSVDETLAAGTYFLAVDGDAPDAFGAYTFEWNVHDLAAQEAGCAGAAVLLDGQSVSGTTLGASNKFLPSCSGSTMGDRVYRFTMASRGRVRLSLTTPRFTGVLALRSSCLDPSGSAAHPVELGCNAASDDAHLAHIEANLEAGTYYVVVDGKGQAGQPGEGAFTLQAHVTR
jgi:hypothetical protein